MVEVLWDNEEVSWEPLTVMRKDDPVTLAQYAKDNMLENHPGWKWARKITKNNKKLLRMTRIMNTQRREQHANRNTKKFKFGVEVPRSVKDALRLDRENRNNKWHDAIKKELEQLMEFNTFNVLGPGEKPPDDYTYVPLLMTFDVKFDGRYKARMCANGSRTPHTGDEIYSGVVGMDTVRLAFFLAALNDLQVCAADVSCAFLQALCKEKIYTRAGVEFQFLGDQNLVGRNLTFHKVLYGTRTASAAFHEACAQVLHQMGYTPSKANPDLWIKDCNTHYEYIATWVDDLLILSKNPMNIIAKLEETYQLKGVGEPSYYLGGDVRKIKVDGVHMWSTDAKTYINRVCEKIEKLMEWTLRSYMSPENPDYHPELDETDFLPNDGISKYRMMIGSLNWVVTLGRFDLCHATHAMARYANAPREGHMNAMRRIFGYLRNYAKLAITYDARMPDLSLYTPSVYDWFRAYPGVEEELPPDMLPPRGNPVKIHGFFDASHASCLQTRRSVTGLLMFLNNTPLMWYSKRQATVETSTYGSELVAGRIACEMAIDLRYRLRMLGVPVHGPVLLFGDNQSMVTNVTVPGSSLKKRSLAIAYHRVRECVAAGIVNIVHCTTDQNLADLMTKPLGPQLFQKLLHNLKLPHQDPGITKTGELKNENVKTSKSSHGKVIFEYSRPTSWEFCPIKEIADASTDKVFLRHLTAYIRSQE